ncbi:hypothetical protein Kpol_2002p63 [Vanderwaltozyma polyspora DSM 70294]|uniref:Prefoldin subunit 1 n=1 Tax=Vanderwaltozyma polyspora (strain ATCC 22028 / DSM 70294 / BCRC 21397 / CBS 2163 / NBRC 10782 / NRRL Y-8283 / UCD 57-17) TaxID=436907 RepID=A7TFH8_VANPO|nr:uncharacterized protein Kpol_2002p63 [Vanderwaltozyma polyspora DSM 70294]EDO18992.1 hypothetical protein Kpol_2002p63 [Vanderwaltozyma polyspora DSM 70294]
MSNQQIAQELTTNLRNVKIQLDTVSQQLMHLETQEKLAEVTTKELESYPNDQIWKACGKAFVLQDKSKYVTDLKEDVGTLKEQKKALNIKRDYLDTTLEKTVDGLKAIMTQK